MKNKKIGVNFHSVANDVYESYDKGKEPKEENLRELYDLSKDFVKAYEERDREILIKEIDRLSEYGQNLERLLKHCKTIK
jgi:hypothetical protein|tara:strand:+ start:136 stop:375 length:240 start_codon:yes stop_codon:yes gene_type:complete